MPGPGSAERHDRRCFASPQNAAPRPGHGYLARISASQKPPPIMKPPEMRETRRVRRAEKNRRQRIDRVGHRRDGHEGDAEQRHLREMILAHIHELRNERAEEHQHFGIGEQRHDPLQEKPAAPRRRRRVGTDALDGKADQFDAEPDQIRRAGKAHPVEPVAHGRHQRGQPDRDDADYDCQPGLGAGDGGQRCAGTVAQSVGDNQRDDRSRHQRQRDAGGDKGEIELQGHGRPLGFQGTTAHYA